MSKLIKANILKRVQDGEQECLRLQHQWEIAKKEHCKDTGKLMREYREQAALSLRKLAGRLCISAAYLSDLESGNRAYRLELVEQAFRAIELYRSDHA
ncbi:helix-turn-helix domain-containing protein [Rubellicoccus peritrichatus]|uniref:Helix-turn-helix domain-containing protein n=1 Tax=Rubellicoccus peritrichatus TaxID=3080537 RepID=A0AAQ3L9Q8_9BACT|nr:helix-turn-helix domain-containing protein [Puniceicoccus sp. CR14]WOO40392.1 helix-turn-helix domain-containing protein [Puniceicoccus sp. CR14]WOO40441.1 helix-turn-helix domain-containing protein [Puniceicoccus sp. CR14]WOO40490.1 helix-turn-helix domain-containing protein [Puniceicoccus sp. CR14]WOO40539.1 helix-turn-helix domain-containing protein [Puniceicoccus sp. CR14]